MNNDSESTANAPIPSGLSSEALTANAAARRRLLLKGIRRGGAVVAAAAPLTSFATLETQRLITVDRTLCSVSGMHSGVHSVSPTSTMCSGNKPSTWGSGTTPTNWPSLGYCTPSTPCKQIFVNCRILNSRGRPASLWEVVKNSPTTDDAHWVCAWLNAQGPSTLNFPYTADQVLAYYNSGNTNALAFFKGYTERI